MINYFLLPYIYASFLLQMSQCNRRGCSDYGVRNCDYCDYPTCPQHLNKVRLTSQASTDHSDGSQSVTTYTTTEQYCDACKYVRDLKASLEKEKDDCKDWFCCFINVCLCLWPVCWLPWHCHMKSRDAWVANEFRDRLHRKGRMNDSQLNYLVPHTNNVRHSLGKEPEGIITLPGCLCCWQVEP